MAVRPLPHADPYASFAEYSDALRLNLSKALHDPLLSRGMLRMHGPGHPVVHSGNFALTFEVVVDGQTYGVRCFHKPSDSLEYRYGAISDHLRSIASPYFVDFEFQPCGITTEDGTYPIVRMEWADGETLATFVARQLNDADVLQSLRSSLVELARHLRANGIAHGDIQPANIIVQHDGRLRLIDYDGMLVPALSGTRSTELGQPNFQHPGRRPWHFNPDLDAFSFALIDVALDALCRKPALWKQTGSNEDTLLWRAEDLKNPANSPLFRALGSVPGLRRRVMHVATISVSPFERIPTFEEFLADHNIPDVPLAFTGDASLLGRGRHDPGYDVVDARNFARCCLYVGDRIELIGQIVGVATSRPDRRDADCIRLEFAEHSNDMVCLKIWPDAIARLEHVPDHTWVGKWVSATGLVEPIHTTDSGSQRHKDLAISIRQSSQLIQLAEAAALERLGPHPGRTRHLPDTMAGVRTMPVDAAPAPFPERPRIEQGAEPDIAPTEGLEPAGSPSAGDASRDLKGPGRAQAGPVRWLWWAAAVLIATIAVYAVLATRASREPDAPAGLAVEIRPPESAPESPPLSSRPAEVGSLESQQNLEGTPGAIVTVAGKLLVGTDQGNGRMTSVLLDGAAIPGLRDNVITLAHRAVFSDREVVVGFTQCAGAEPPCGHKVPFWLELRAGVPAELRRKTDLWTGSGSVSVTATDGGVRIALGLWDGERRHAILTPAGNIVVTRERAAIGKLTRADCQTVLQSVEACRASRDCSSLESSAQRISPAERTQLTRMYHESTGFDATAFRGLCVRSCELGWTPSAGFIRRHVCNGARADQWSSSDPTKGLF